MVILCTADGNSKIAQEFKTAIRPVYVKIYKYFSIPSTVTKNPEDVINMIMKTNDALSDACELSNRFFAYQLVIIVAIAFFTTLFDLYYLLDILIQHSRDQEPTDISFILFFAAQLVYYVIVIFLLVQESTEIMAEVRT